MASRFNLMTVYTTLVAKIQEIITTLHDDSISPDIEYMAWDSRGDVTELPSHDLIGLVDWTFSENDDHRPDIECAILLSVVNDMNLFREVLILDAIRDACVHQTRDEYLVWTMKDDDGEPFSQLQVTDFTVMPSGESEARTVRQIGISLKRVDNAK